MILRNKIISPYYSGEKTYLERNEIIELKYEEKILNDLKTHPIYGKMDKLYGAYVSVETILNIINNL